MMDFKTSKFDIPCSMFVIQCVFRIELAYENEIQYSLRLLCAFFFAHFALKIF